MSDPFRDIAAASRSDPDSEVVFWAKEIDLALKREKKWRKKADELIRLYEAKKMGENSFNILYSNTETLLPACYNQLPRPEVERRYKDADPLGKQSAEALERCLEYLMDSADAEYDPFHSLMMQAVLGALVPGRGLTRFKYDPEFAPAAPAVGYNDEAEEGAGGPRDEGAGDTDSEAQDTLFEEPKAGERVVYEIICGTDIDHTAFLMGYGRRWVDVPWVAFEHRMTKEDLEDNFPPEVAAAIPLEEPAKRDPDMGYRKGDLAEGEDNMGSVKVAQVWEIWDKRKKEILLYAPQYTEKKIAKKLEDPYELSGFFPCPEPLQFLLKRSDLTPTPLYELYAPQAKELNSLSTRINRVLNAMKVRGFYDGTIQGMKDLLSADDNTLLPAKNVASLQDGKTLMNSIWMMPLNELQVVLQQLMIGRESCKATIYEITGISDIMRGDTQASETATAQTLKSKFGSLRLKRMQSQVQVYIRDCLRIMGELAGKHFGEETFVGMTNLSYATNAEVQQAQQVLQQVQQAQLQMQQQAQQAASMAQMMGQPPPPPPQPPQQLMQAAQEAQATLQKPKWSDVLGLLQSDMQRYYKIDIETNSTIAADTAEDQQKITECMTALGNMYQSFGPVVQAGAMPLGVLKEMTLAVIRRFSFGRQVEDAIMQMPDEAPQQGQDPAAAEKVQKELEAREQKVMQDEQALQQKGQDLAMQEKQAAMDEELRKADDLMRQKEAEMQTAASLKDAERSLQEMLDKHMMDVERKVMQGEQATALAITKAGAQQQAVTDKKTLQQNEKTSKDAANAAQQNVKMLTDTVTALTKSLSGGKKVTLERDAGGRASGLTVRPTTVQ